MAAREMRPLNGWAHDPRAAPEQVGLLDTAAAEKRVEIAPRSPTLTRADPDLRSGAWEGVGDGEGGGRRGGGEDNGFASRPLPPPGDPNSRSRDGGEHDDARVASVSKSTTHKSPSMSFPSLPEHQRVDVVFEDLRVGVRESYFSSECKTLLHGVSGHFRAGELVAVMGPSGAGKSTLLNTASGFMSGLITGGSVRLQDSNGRVVKRQNSVCYLTQEDHVQPFFTVREIVQQSADLKVGSQLSRKARGIIVDDLLETLGLSECSNTRAGRLSGGQRKRLAIAAELVDNPAVVFLDEPTSGLDMSSATHCAQLMQRIARSGRAVICTIHQPSENLLAMFDQVYVLANGQCVYRGTPSQLLPFLSNLGYQCPKYHNPADFMMEVANNEYGIADQRLAEAVQQSTTIYPPALPFLKELDGNTKEKDPNINEKVKGFISTRMYSPSEWERFRVLVTRNLLLQHRDWFSTQMKIISAFFVFIVVGLLYGKIGDNADRVVSNVSILFITPVYMAYTAEAPGVLKYSDEIQVVKREWFNHCYKLYTYSCALFISALPMHVMTSTISCSICYYMTGQLAEPMRFAHVTLATILTSIGSESLGLQFGSLFLKKKIVSLFIATTHLAFMILFSGFLALKPEMPVWYEWLTRFNHLAYAVNTLIVSVYQDRGQLNCPEDLVYCHIRDSQSVLNLFGLGNDQLWQNFLGLVVAIVLLRISGYYTLNYNMKRVNL